MGGASSFRLEYLNFGGRGEPIKLAASYSVVAFDSKMMTIPEQKAWKAAGKQCWSGPPDIVLLEDGKDVATIGQSNAILRFLGRKFGLYPENALQAAYVDAILDSQEDVLNAFVKNVFIVQDADAKAAGAKKLIEETFPYWFGKFEARLVDNEKRGDDTGFFVGDEMSIADFKSYTSFALFRGALAEAGIADLFKKYERITRFLDIMDNDEKVKAALAVYAANYEVFNKDNKKNLFKHAGKYVSLAK